MEVGKRGNNQYTSRHVPASKSKAKGKEEERKAHGSMGRGRLLREAWPPSDSPVFGMLCVSLTFLLIHPPPDAVPIYSSHAPARYQWTTHLILLKLFLKDWIYTHIYYSKNKLSYYHFLLRYDFSFLFWFFCFILFFNV